MQGCYVKLKNDFFCWFHNSHKKGLMCLMFSKPLAVELKRSHYAQEFLRCHQVTLQMFKEVLGFV